MARGGDRIVADGRQRLRDTSWWRSEERKIREAVSRKYEPELATAGLVRRAIARVRMWREIRQKTDALAPEGALYLRAHGDDGR